MMWLGAESVLRENAAHLLFLCLFVLALLILAIWWLRR